MVELCQGHCEKAFMLNKLMIASKMSINMIVGTATGSLFVMMDGPHFEVPCSSHALVCIIKAKPLSAVTGGTDSVNHLNRLMQ